MKYLITMLILLNATPVPARSPPVKTPWPLHVQTGADRALERLDRALAQYERGAEALDDSLRLKREFEQAINGIVHEQSGTRSLARTLWTLLIHREQAVSNLRAQILPHLYLPLNSLSREMADLYEELERECLAAVEELAWHLAEPVPQIDSEGKMSAPSASPTFEATLNRLGWSGAGFGLAVGFDVLALRASTLHRTLPAKLNTLFPRVLGPSAARLTASAGLVVADGPLPFGDMLALGGLLWTGYDLWNAPHRFRQVLHADLGKAVLQMRTDLRKTGNKRARDRVQAHQEAVEKLLRTALGEEDDE